MPKRKHKSTKIVRSRKKCILFYIINRYLGPIDLAQYFVKEISIYEHKLSTDYGSSEAIRIDIVFSRRMLGTLLTTYLPTLLLCMVCFATSYFKVKWTAQKLAQSVKTFIFQLYFFQAFFFEATVTVNLTSLLVLTTLFISISNRLLKLQFRQLWCISL